MKNILFVCMGNVARSQMAEAIMQKKHPHLQVMSAGIQEDTPEKYVNPVIEVVEVMNEVGIDVSNKLVKTISEDMVKSADQIVVLCKKSECPQFLLDSGKIIFWEVSDPYKSSLDNFRNIRKQISRLIEENYN